jgi:hypothetical protein
MYLVLYGSKFTYPYFIAKHLCNIFFLEVCVNIFRLFHIFRFSSHSPIPVSEPYHTRVESSMRVSLSLSLSLTHTHTQVGFYSLHKDV